MFHLKLSSANIIKEEDGGSATSDGGVGSRLKLNTLLCVHGNKVSQRESVRTDASVASHLSFRCSEKCERSGRTNGTVSVVLVTKIHTQHTKQEVSV